MNINIIPFGEVTEDRFEEAKKYKLVEMTAGFWRLTSKCKDNYDPLAYIKYLKGSIERESVPRVKEKQQVQRDIPVKRITKQSQINQLLAL